MIGRGCPPLDCASKRIPPEVRQQRERRERRRQRERSSRDEDALALRLALREYEVQRPHRRNPREQNGAHNAEVDEDANANAQQNERANPVSPERPMRQE